MEVFPAELRAGALSRRSSRARRRRWQLLGPPPRPASPGSSCSTSAPTSRATCCLKADLASMAHSLELRSPLLDWEVLELGVSLPRLAEAQGPAAASWRCGAPSPPSCRPRSPARGKTGFGVPLARLVPRGAPRARRRRPARRRARGRAASFAPAAVERLLARPRRRARRPRPPPLVPADARALAADAPRQRAAVAARVPHRVAL